VTLVTDLTAALLAGDDARRAKLNGPTSARAILTTAELISALQAGPTAAD